MDSSPQQPIVVAVDGSQHAYEATEWAAELASALDAPLHLLDIQSPGVGRRSTPTWLGMLRVAAWRAGTDPDVIESSSGRLADLLAERADTARLLVLGVDLVAVTAESATVSGLAERSRCPIVVVRGHGPGLCPPLHGPVVVASGPDVPPFIADLAGAFRATVSMVNIEDGDADLILPNLLEQARHARVVVLASPNSPTGPHPWLADSSRQLIERALCPVVVIGPGPKMRPLPDSAVAATATT
jgi:nucleotide-binding universal stress UspA family protein